MFARTPRLTLRPAWREDAPMLAQAIAHESVATKLANMPWPYDLTDAQGFIDSPPAAGEAICLIVAHEEGTRLVGGIGIHQTPAGPEIGYWLTPAAWGRGYATEAGRAMLGMARHALGHRRLVSGHFIDNPASGRVLRKLGFVPTGRVGQRPCRARGQAVAYAYFEKDLADDDARPTTLMAA